jgi:hypothetical protein
MKTTRWFSGALLVCVTLMALATASVESAKAQSKLRIGTYDSRAVIVAYANSKHFKNPTGDLMAKMKTAKEKNDTKEIARLEREGQLRQAMMHEQGFGTGSIRNVMETVREKTALLANKEKLDIVVSKWELAYIASDAELIDITEKVADFFGPNEKMKPMIREMMKQAPVKDAYLIED